VARSQLALHHSSLVVESAVVSRDGYSVVTSTVASDSDLLQIRGAARMCHPDVEHIDAALPTSTSYLKLVDVPFFTVGDARITPDGVFFKFKSTIYYAVLDRSPQQTIQKKYSLRVYTCKIGRDTTALTSPFRVVMSPARTKRGQENDKEHWALRHLPKPALAPNGRQPPSAQSTPQRCSQPKPDTRVPRDLAPPVKGRYIPIGRPKQLPEGGVDSPLGPPPKGGVLPQTQTTRREANDRQAACSQMGVIRPAHSPHPGSQASRGRTIAQKAAFVCTNLVKVGTVSNNE
jgi:hypothetical protein